MKKKYPSTAKSIEDELPPHEPQAEAFLLACAVHKPEILVGLTPELFYLVEHQTILVDMKRMKADGRKSVETPELFEHDLMLSLPRNVFQAINIALNELPSPANWTYWQEIVVERAQARKLLGIKPALDTAAAGVLAGNKSPIRDIAKTLDDVSRSGTAVDVSSNMKLLDQQAGEILEEVWSKGDVLLGLPTGFDALNKATDGLQAQKFYVVAGRPGKGKSAFLVQIAYHAAISGFPTLFISLEMPATEIYMRIASQISHVPHARFKKQTATQEDFDNLSAARLSIRKSPLTILDSLFTLSDILQAMEAAIRDGAKLVVVDYIQKVRVPNSRENRATTIAEITGAFKELAMKHKIPVLAAAQINRDAEKEGRAPTLSDLRESGAIEQDADLVGFLHQKDKGIDLLIAKNRSGPPARIPLIFKGEIFRFDSI